MAKYFGFAISDSMFEGNIALERRVLSTKEARELIEAGDTIPCLNPSHGPTIRAMREKFGIQIGIPDSPPRVQLHPGDELIVMSVRGLPRLTDRHEYTSAEVANATFAFSHYKVKAL